jgi:hypothetical protein
MPEAASLKEAAFFFQNIFIYGVRRKYYPDGDKERMSFSNRDRPDIPQLIQD